MSAIKPGCLCWLVICDFNPDWVGRVVVAVRFLPGAVILDPLGIRRRQSVWEIAAPWMPPTSTGTPWAAEQRCLIPLNDPDADMTTDRKELLDLLLYAEQHPSTIPTLTERQP